MTSKIIMIIITIYLIIIIIVIFVLLKTDLASSNNFDFTYYAVSENFYWTF